MVTAIVVAFCSVKCMEQSTLTCVAACCAQRLYAEPLETSVAIVHEDEAFAF